MTGQIAVEGAAFERARREVVDTHEELERERARLVREAAELLDDGWQGPAATQYARAWAEWEVGADRVVDALGRLSSAMAAARVELALADTSAAAGSARLLARLGG
ncbi:MAG: WXG100 family type VII secretion target [Nocardioides sp.]